MCSKKSSATSSTVIHNDKNSAMSTGCWRKRLQFSSERLDLILSNLNRNLSKSVDGYQCKQIGHDVSYSRDDQHCQQHQQQQRRNEDRCSKVLTAHNTIADGSDIRLNDEFNPPAVQNVSEASQSCNNNTHHSDVARHASDSDDVEFVALAEGNPPDVCRIKKSVSFRRNCNADDDKHLMNRVFHSLPRPQHRKDQRQQHRQTASEVSHGPILQTSPNTNGSDRDRLSLKDVLRGRNKQQDERGSRGSQSKWPDKRSTSASRLTTRKDTDVTQKSSTSRWSSIKRSDDRKLCPTADPHLRRPTSITWYADSTDSARTQLRSPASFTTSGVNHVRDNCQTGAGTKTNPDVANEVNCKLEPELSSRTTSSWRDMSGRCARATTIGTLGQLDQQTDVRHHYPAQTMKTSSSSTCALADLGVGEKFTHLQRTWSLKGNRSSMLSTSKDSGSKEPAFYRSSGSQFRRSMIETKPKYAETFCYGRSAVQPAERCDSTRPRSVSLSEQYRKLIGGDWFEDFATSSAVINRQKMTPTNGSHNSFTLSYKLKPDFVICV